MCEWNDVIQVRVLVPADLAHEGVDTWKSKPIDRCIAPLVAALNAAGIVTRASCCGHGKREGVVSLNDGRELVIRPDRTMARADRTLAERARELANRPTTVDDAEWYPQDLFAAKKLLTALADENDLTQNQLERVIEELERLRSENEHEQKVALADLCDTYREALEEATGLLHWFNTAHAGTPDYRILRQRVTEFCRAALATGEQ